MVSAAKSESNGVAGRKADDVMQALSAFSKGKKVRRTSAISRYDHGDSKEVTNRMNAMDQHLAKIATMLQKLDNTNTGSSRAPLEAPNGDEHKS